MPRANIVSFAKPLLTTLRPRSAKLVVRVADSNSSSR